MTSKDKVNRDLEDVRAAMLGELSPLERVRLFAKAAATDHDEWIETIWETAPKATYEMPDAAAQSGARSVFLLSVLANAELARLETQLQVHEAERDRSVALVLLNEALSRLSGGQFRVAAYGPTEFPDSWPASYGLKYDPQISKLASKFRALWDETALEFAVPEDERSRPYFPELAATAMLAYRTDLSDEAFDEFPPFTHSAVYFSEVRVIRTLVDFYRSFQAWRLLAEEHLEISFDELLGVAQHDDAFRGPFATHEGRQLDHEQCETILSLSQLYFDAYEDVLEALCDHSGEAFGGVPDLDEQAAEYAAELAAMIDVVS